MFFEAFTPGCEQNPVRTTRQRLCEGAAPIIDGILSGRLLDTCLTLEMHYNRVKFLRYELLVKGGQLG